ncbi:chromosome segregation protein SMC [Orrella sp. 11846]|uniref:chromosome segregation protein SMC n=1 Tax=Orrella sp. 11846 TaxID=3409913 RepID=UPI003B5C6B7D
MRLTHIKLAGFKSFVDPTVIPTPSQLVGVVGPNGCGKSNIMDAVRWVLGESRASELRGESMQDVIFSGSGERKPSARASVELVFDNQEGRAAGQWSPFAEISVRRVLTRDGTSSYFINQQSVRRKDIHDLFLGTGLGSRGYAIIGQGMINRLLEARPQDMRVYLEEAAGVSRYKERRRETENRLRDTHDNLLRVNDIIQELNSQQIRLQAQAEVAKQYETLQTEMQWKLHALWCLREQLANDEAKALALQTQQAQTNLEQSLAQIRRLETELTQQRQQHYDASDAVHKAQGELYESNAQVASFEAQLRHAAQTRERIESRQQQLQTQIEQWQSQLQYCEEEIARHQILLDQAQMDVEQTQALAQEVGEQLPQIESQVHQALSTREQLRTQITRFEQQNALADQRTQDGQRQLEQLRARHERLSQERSLLDEQDTEVLESLVIEVEMAQEQLVQAQAQLDSLEVNLSERILERRKAQQSCQALEQQHSNLQARLNALETLQNQLATGDALQPWLQRQGWQDWPRLLPHLKVESGWEAAIESALQDRLYAYETDELGTCSWDAFESPPARLSVFERPDSVVSVVKNDQLIPLSHYVSAEDERLRSLLQSWLTGFYVATDLAEAVAKREALPVGGAWVVASGHVVDAWSVRFYAPDSEQSGMLARQQEIEALRDEFEALEPVLNKRREDLETLEAQCEEITQSLTESRQQVAELTRRHQEAVLLQRQRTHEIEQIRLQAQRLDQDLAEVDAQHQEQVRQLSLVDEARDEADASLEIAQSQLEDVEQTWESLNAQMQQMQAHVRQTERREQEAVFGQRATQAKIEELERNQQLSAEQKRRDQVELENLQIEFETLEEDSVRERLQEALEIRHEREMALTTLRQSMDALAHTLRQTDEARLTLEHSMAPARESVTQLQLKEQAARLSAEQFEQQIKEHEVSRQSVAAYVQTQSADWTKPGWLQSEVQRIRRDVEAMGAVNLAALEELKTTQQRLEYLQAQHEDLVTAIETLEAAIQKIDRETRDLLQTTFDAVNENFGALFPQLFGGGRARLEMTGDQILDAGVQVMAQPPGKRNTTIALLSGGEKALTAIALVFALFKLNPAPFCLLDEVDAPLDDANTERYARLVSSMSEQTQFLFISHNKIAMQMAKHLIGVTMQEQGVSRIVAVDMDSALQMASQAA